MLPLGLGSQANGIQGVATDLERHPPAGATAPAGVGRDNGDGCPSSCEGARGIETADFSTVTNNKSSGNGVENCEFDRTGCFQAWSVHE